MSKVWASSADSHVMEPDDLWLTRLPSHLADRGPLVTRDDKKETASIDGRVAFRTLAAFADASARAPGAFDARLRVRDLDEEGVWGQVMFPSRGLWIPRATDAELTRECCRVYNDWVAGEVMSISERLVGVAMLSHLDTVDAIAELQRAAGLGYKAALLPTTPPAGREFNDEVWEPLWAAAAEAKMLVAFHVGTGSDPVQIRGQGAAVINYVETFVPGQRVLTHLVASGVLDRHPGLNVLIAEGGATWVPNLADRMDEAYRQHGMYVLPKLSMLPSELLYRQAYASFQHDKTAVAAVTAMGYRNVLWGDDYPHMEGTWGHTQATIKGLFDGVDDDVAELVLRGNFEKLFGVAVPTGAV